MYPDYVRSMRVYGPLEAAKLYMRWHINNRSILTAELIIKILLPTKLSYSNSIERLNSLLGDCFPFRFHLRGGWERALSSAVLKRLKSAAGFVSDIVGLSVGFQIATSSGFSNQSRHAVRTGDEAGYCKGGWRVRNRKYLRV